jgi:hypothetical protein
MHLPYKTPNVPSTKSHVSFPLPRSCQRISPGPRSFETFRNKTFYGEGLSAPRSTPKLKDHPLSAVRDCLFNIFAATLRTRRTSLHPQPEDAPCCGAKGPTYHGHSLHKLLKMNALVKCSVCLFISEIVERISLKCDIGDSALKTVDSVPFYSLSVHYLD